LFPWSGNPYTSIGIWLWDKGKAYLNQHIFKVKPETSEDRALIYTMLKHLVPTFINLATHKQTTGLGHVTVANLKELKIVYPSKESLKIFNKEANPIMELIFNNQMETISLTKTRDTLLPKLISGEVQVKDLEQLLN
jgi:type I restriction enzyme S subunit